MFKIRNRFIRPNHFLILCILSLIFYYFIHQRLNYKNEHFNKSNDEKGVQLFIDRIRDIAILDQNVVFNITYHLISNDTPKWLNQYGISHLFDFYWLRNGAYLWHLQCMMNFKQNSRIPKTHFPENFHQMNIFDYLYQHPENGIIIDTASDPIQPLFPPLPQSSSSLEKICTHYQWLNDWYPCKIRSEMISLLTFKPLLTYALYDVTINICAQCTRSSASPAIHYNEVIYLYDNQQQKMNETFFVQQILPRLIRLLGLVPQTAVILLPYFSTKIYVNQYIDVLIERGLVHDKKRFIEYNSSEIYHANVIYSTSSPRSDLILLNQILIGNKSSVRRELILLIRNNLDKDSYNGIIQTIDQFEFPEGFEYLRVQEYNEESYNLTQFRDLFQQARIVIGMQTDILSHIVWCLPGTHLIEIIQKTMTTDYYEISLQLRFNYWLVMSTNTNKIDIIDFRSLMMKILANIDA